MMTERATRALPSWVRGRELLLLAAALFVLLSIAYAFSADIRASRGASITGDEPFYLLTTQSLLNDGDLDLRNQYEAKSYQSFFDHPDDLWHQSVPTDDGRLLSPHNPGLSVLLIPAFALGGLLGVQIHLLLMAAATMTLAFVLADRITGLRLISWVAALAVGLTATAFIYSTEVYPEFPAALTLVVALLVVTRRPQLRWTDGLALAVVLSFMCWLGVKYAPLAFLVAGYFLYKADQSGRMSLLAAGGISAAAFAWFHLHVFGSLTPYGVNVVYARWTTPEILSGHVEFGDRYYRLWGIFVDRRFGIGRWAPLLLLVVPGLVLLARAAAPHRLTLGLILAQLLIATFVAITMMGWWFAGRTMLTVLPLCVVPLALLVVRMPRWGKIGAALLAAYTLAITAGLAQAGHAREITIAGDPFDMAYLPFQWVAGIFPLYTWWTAETWRLTYLWWAVAGVSVALVMRPQITSLVRRLWPLFAHRPGEKPSAETQGATRPLSSPRSTTGT